MRFRISHTGTLALGLAAAVAAAAALAASVGLDESAGAGAVNPFGTDRGTSGELHDGAAARYLAPASPIRYTAPRPPIISRKQWGADEHLRDKHARYAPAVLAIVVHHTESGNGYRCSDVPKMIRNLYVGHVEDRDWGDLGYNFLVDKCGHIYEGRAGGVDRPVIGAHAEGFNTGTVGVAAIGSYGPSSKVPYAVKEAIARVAAWKLGKYGIDPREQVQLRSTDSRSRFHAGTDATLSAISGHRDGYETYCPGRNLYDALPWIRNEAARLQGRT